MPRIARFTVEDGVYHILSRGNNRQDIFHRDEDHAKFKELLNHYADKFKIEVYHYVLMSNHIHSIIKSGDGETLSRFMKGVLSRYVQEYRKSYGGVGHLWQDRFKSFLIQRGSYLLECGRYIELNPVRAGIVRSPEEYKWSSYWRYATGEIDELVTLSPEYLGLSDDEEVRRRIYTEYTTGGLGDRRRMERYFKVGAYGSKGFINKLVGRGLESRWSHPGQPKKTKNVRKE